jgi:hypothetical protein
MNTVLIDSPQSVKLVFLDSRLRGNDGILTVLNTL